MRHAAREGFSLVEVMVVIAIIGMLAALAMPKITRFQAKAKQSEAKTNLAHIYTLQRSYFEIHATYADSTANAGFGVDGDARYNYSIESASFSDFLAQAEAKSNGKIQHDCGFLDTWTMNSARTLTVVKNCIQ